MPIVGMPDGTQVQFPDDMPADQIKGLIAQKFPQETASSQKPISARDLFGREFLGQGVAFGAGDEAEAAAKALYAKSQGDNRSLSDVYGENLKSVRDKLKTFEAEHPTEASLAELSGAVAPALLSRGRTVPASIGKALIKGGLTGAGVGAAYGFGTGEGSDNRIAQALQGATFGGAVGAAAAPISTVLTTAGRYIGAPLANTVRGLFNADNEAARRVATAIDRDAGKGLTQQQQALATQVTGQPVANVDLGDETTRALARSAANTSPEARAAVNKAINDRFESQGDRVKAWLGTNMGATGDISAVREQASQAARAANKPLYLRAYAQGDQPIWSQEMARLAGSPDVQAAMRSAIETGKSRAINEGLGGFRGPQVTQDGRLVFAKGPNGVPTYPNLQYWDYVKRDLDAAANRAARAGDNEAASRLRGQAKLLTTELDRAVPSYAQARSTAAGFFKADNALDAGANFVDLNSDINAARRALAKFSPQERQMFQTGFVSSLLDKVNKIGDRADVVKRIWGNPKARTQIQLVLGPKAREFEAFMGVEAVMDRARGAVQGNSTTTRQLVEMGLAGGAGGIATGDWKTGLIAGLAYGAGRKGLARVDERVARRVGEMLASSDPTIYQRGIKSLANSKKLMANLRSYITALSGSVAGQQGSQSSGGAE